jgi:uncharacterized protein YgbK (DUF1537 family)
LETSIKIEHKGMSDAADNSSEHHACLAFLVADDLTGACDAGVHFARAGLRSVVELSSDTGSSHTAAGPEADVRIVNSRSRHLAPEAAAKEVKRLAWRASPDASTIFFKKVDSTLRGNTVSEARAMMRAAGFDLAVVAPALPSQGRAVAGGMLYVRDCTGSFTIDARALLSRQGLDGVATLATSAAETPEKIAREILKFHAAGAEFILCDSETEEDLNRIAQALHELPRRVLWVGSAGLAKSAAQVLGGVRRPSRAARIGDAKTRAKHEPAPILFCVGSDHPVTMLQARCLKESGRAGALDAMAATPDDVREIIRRGRHPLLQISSTRESPERIRLLIAEAKSAGISAALLTGGNTAESVCDAIGAAKIWLRDEVSPGIPWGIFHGGLLDNLRVATKAGGFGDERALLHAAEHLGAIESDAQ